MAAFIASYARVFEYFLDARDAPADDQHLTDTTGVFQRHRAEQFVGVVQALAQLADPHLPFHTVLLEHVHGSVALIRKATFLGEGATSALSEVFVGGIRVRRVNVQELFTTIQDRRGEPETRIVAA